MNKKIIGILVCILFFGASNVSSIYIQKDVLGNNRSNILYVGGSGPGNYTTIQAAINDANNDDTVYVYSGEYFENIIVSKSITLLGEDKHTTIVNGKGTIEKDVIKITRDNILINGFTIINSGNDYWESGVLITSNSNIVSNNLIYDCMFGIRIDSADYNTVSENEIYTNEHDGVWLNDAYYNSIEDNMIYENGYDGLDLWHGSNSNDIINNMINNNDHNGIWIYNSCNQNTFIGNKITNNQDNGISMSDCVSNSFESNNIQSNKKIGISLVDSKNIYITNNNIFQNRRNIHFILPDLGSKNMWDGNYFGFKLLSFHLVFGWKTLYAERAPTGEVIFRIPLPCLDFDWNIAKQPYDI